MCGIWGTYHNVNIDHQQKAILWDMFRVGVVRGTQGTGIVSVDNKNELMWRKVGGEPYMMYYTEKFDEFIKKVLNDSRYIFGHHRAATKGEVNDDNAHPFQHGHITLVHNGTLTGGVSLKEGQVDSDALTKLVADEGAREAFSKVFGPYACIWWDAKQKRLNFIKNGGRPLSIWKARGNHFWASEEGMLEWLLKRHYTTIEDKDILKYKIETDTIYFLDGGAELKKEVEPLKKTYYTPPPAQSTYVYPQHTTQTRGVGSQKPSSPPVAADYLADFYLLSEEMKTYGSGVVKWKYLGLSDMNENIVAFLDEPLPAGYTNIHWHGQLKKGPRMNYSKLVDATQDEGAVFYEVEPHTIIELLEPDPKSRPKYETKDGHALSKNKMKRYCKEGCITCKGAIFEHEVPKCLAFTTAEGDPKALFCARCSEAAIRRAEKIKSNNVILLPNQQTTS